jgi:hypothetical protein
MERQAAVDGNQHVGPAPRSSQSAWIVAAIAYLVFLVGILSPPHLMNDVDAVQAQATRDMLASGDGVTDRLDGIAYPLAEGLQKSPPGESIEGDAYYAFASVFFYPIERLCS